MGHWGMGYKGIQGKDIAGTRVGCRRLPICPILWQPDPVESPKTVAVVGRIGSPWGSPTVSYRNAPAFWEGLPVTQRESATPATRQLLEEGRKLTHPHLAALGLRLPLQLQLHL